MKDGGLSSASHQEPQRQRLQQDGQDQACNDNGSDVHAERYVMRMREVQVSALAPTANTQPNSFEVEDADNISIQCHAT